MSDHVDQPVLDILADFAKEFEPNAELAEKWTRYVRNLRATERLVRWAPFQDGNKADSLVVAKTNIKRITVEQDPKRFELAFDCPPAQSSVRRFLRALRGNTDYLVSFILGDTKKVPKGKDRAGVEYRLLDAILIHKTLLTGPDNATPQIVPVCYFEWDAKETKWKALNVGLVL